MPPVPSKQIPILSHVARTITAGTRRISREPPFRILTKAWIRAFARSIRTKCQWDVSARPAYLFCVLHAADEALSEGVSEMCVVEFGVAGGNGLVALGTIAEQVEAETGVRIRAYGFDTGEGLPTFCGDYRDHPDVWSPCDFPMDEPRLRSLLPPNTELILGDVRDTVPAFISQQSSPAGFLSMDLDLYSSTREALQLLSNSHRKMLRRTFLYFDDIDYTFSHRFAGELHAIDEFNELQEEVKIDEWRGAANGRVFSDQRWLKKIYIAHDLEAIGQCTPGNRHVRSKPLRANVAS